MVNILLIEDNPVDARLIQRTLTASTEWQVQITWIDDGEKALWYLRSLETAGVDHPPVLVLLDVNLPRYDGLQVLQAFRNSAVTRRLPVFLMSSTPAEYIQEQAESRQVQADGYFEKPLGMPELEAFASHIRRFCQAVSLSEARTAVSPPQSLQAHP